MDLDKFPASKVHQLAKKYESSMATARHIKQIAGEMQATQIHLMRHQCTELSYGKYKKQKPQAKPRPMQNKNAEQKQPRYHKESFDPRNAYRQKDRCSKCGDSTHLEGFTCPAKRYQCKSCHKFGYFKSLCFMKGQQKQAYHKPCKPKAYQRTAGTIQAYDNQSESESSDNSFCLQLQIKCVQAQNKTDKKPACLITNLPYRLKMHENRNLYLRARLDTCTDVNIMPTSVYKLVFCDPNLEKLIPNKLQIGTYTNNTVKIMETCKLYLVHPDTKKLIETIFYVATNDGSVLLSCKSTLALDLIQPRSRLDYLPPRASLLTSTQNHPKKTKQVQAPVQKLSSKQLCAQSQPKAETSTPSNVHDSSQLPAMKQQKPCKMISSKDQIIRNYPDVFKGIGKFPGPLYTIHLDPSIQPKQTPCRPVPIHLKETFKKEIDQMLQAGVLKPLTEATPWINSLVLVESKDKSRNHKLRICLDLTNLNKANIREPYHFKTPEDIAHLIAGACTMKALDCHEGYWHQQLDEQSSYMMTFNTEFGRYRYTVMPFGATVAGDVFLYKLDECFGHIPNVIVIADDNMVVGKQPNQKDHDQALTTLLETARHCNVRLNYEKLQYKQMEVELFGDTYTVDGHKPAKRKVQAIVEMLAPSCKKEVQSFIGMINYLSKFSARLSELALPIRELAKDKVAFNWDPEHQAAFKLVKKEIAAVPILAYYDPKKTTVLQTDASINGLGTCLLQDDNPVYFASKALMEAQHGYVAIELGVSCSSLGNGKVPSLSVWESLPT